MATLTINALMEGLAKVAQLGVSAKAWMNGEPTQKPPGLPFLFVQWQATEPSAGNNSVRTEAGKLQKRGVKRLHTGNIYVLVTSGPDVGFDAAPINRALDGLLNAIDADEALTQSDGSDLCQKVTLGRVELFRQAWEENGPVFSGFRAPFTLIQTA